MSAMEAPNGNAASAGTILPSHLDAVEDLGACHTAISVKRQVF
jgi:hypothetical protein